MLKYCPVTLKRAVNQDNTITVWFQNNYSKCNTHLRSLQKMPFFLVHCPDSVPDSVVLSNCFHFYGDFYFAISEHLIPSKASASKHKEGRPRSQSLTMEQIN